MIRNQFNITCVFVHLLINSSQFARGLQTFSNQQSISKFVTELETDESISEIHNALSSYEAQEYYIDQSYQTSSDTASDDVSIAENGKAVLNIKRLKNCGRVDRCDGKGDDFMKAPVYSSQETWMRRHCFCDEECAIYGDCCIDRSYLDKPDSVKGHLNKHWGCIAFNRFQGVFGIDDCEGPLNQLCSKTNKSDPEKDVAVYSASSGIVYANVYCALCHGLHPSDIVFPNVTKICDRKLKSQQLHDAEYSDLRWTKKRENCTVSGKTDCLQTECLLNMEGLPTRGRYCQPGILKTCPNGDKTLHNLCEAYSLPVASINTRKVYKNPHCALCHNEDIKKNVLCYRGLSAKEVPSFTELISLDWRTVSCQWPQTIWDTESKSCLQLFCDQDVCALIQPEASSSKINVIQAVESNLTVVTLAISITLLLIHNCLYYSDTKRHNLPSQILKSLSWSIIFAHISFLFIGYKDSVSLTICKLIGYSVQFFYTASFFWMNVMSYDVWRTFSKVKLRGSPSSVMKKYNIYSWGCTVLIIVITITSDLIPFLPYEIRPDVGQGKFCYFDQKLSMAVYFLLPVFIILLINLYLFGKTVFWFQKQTSKELERCNYEATNRKEYRKVWLYIKLLTIMGLTWLFCIVAAMTHINAFRYIFIICNGLQGAMIFFMFDLKKRVLIQFVDNIKRRTNWSVNDNSTDSKNKETIDTNASIRRCNSLK